MVIILFSPWGCPFPVCLNNLIERTISSQKRAWSRGLICRLQNQHWLDASLGKWSLPVFSDGRGSELVPQWAHLMGNQLTNHSSAEGNCPLHVGLRRKEVKENGILWSALERMGLDLENSRIPGCFFWQLWCAGTHSVGCRRELSDNVTSSLLELPPMSAHTSV